MENQVKQVNVVFGAVIPWETLSARMVERATRLNKIIPWDKRVTDNADNVVYVDFKARKRA